MTKDDIVKMLETMATISGTTLQHEYENFIAEGGWELLIKNVPNVYSQEFHDEVETAVKGESQVMAKRYINELVALADTLDKKGLTAEANEIDKIVKSWNTPESRSLRDTMWFQNKEKRKEEEKEKESQEEKPAKWLDETPKSIV